MNNHIQREYATVLLLILALFLSGCETSLNETQAGAIGGSALGAGLGAIIGNQTGHAGAGTAIGAGAGALAGGLIGEGIRRSKATTQQPVVYQQPAQTAQAAPVQAQPTEVHTKFCPTCGRTYIDSTKFCLEDGTELQAINT